MPGVRQLGGALVMQHASQAASLPGSTTQPHLKAHGGQAALHRRQVARVQQAAHAGAQGRGVRGVGGAGGAAVAPRHGAGLPRHGVAAALQHAGGGLACGGQRGGG